MIKTRIPSSKKSLVNISTMPTLYLKSNKKPNEKHEVLNVNTVTKKKYKVRPRVVDKKTDIFSVVSKKNGPKRENASVQENERHTQSHAERLVRQANKEATEKREAEIGRDSVRKRTLKPQEYRSAPGQMDFKNRSVGETRDYDLSGRTVFFKR
ncbi:uncharacterized protein J4E84_010609 [Alternaria hordeiaustralica]|uniref:uncharacterized protein n=1 Tax=Alternaria hordeiaustralica TaxID=1187925 RepID=UPI0020C24A7D|nr:uncharacterized protein J4E84_010609 [Alternaria hordeiaustralica]KAI4674371.1 hypothetical protein J4E84_010609 [Alternaria hordeiaustralica]